MEKATVIALLEKYWQAETTIGEEKALAEYFRGQDDADPELEPYRDLFRYFGHEAQVSAGPDFEDRILQRVGLAARPVRTFRVGFISAAAAICAIVMGLFLLTPGGKQTPPDVVSTSPAMVSTSPAIVSTTIRDTYDDPEQALTAVRHALLVASAHLNEGRRSITGAKK